MTSDPDPQELAQAAFLLRLAARPVILAGGGVVHAAAGDELGRVAGKLDAPVITTWNGKGALADTHPFSAGALFGQPEAAEALESADTVFALGTSLDAGPGSAELSLPAQMIQIDSDPDQLGSKHPLRLGIAGDVRRALDGILHALEAPNPLKGVADRTSVPEGDRTGPARAARLRKTCRDRAVAENPQAMAAVDGIRSVLADDVVVSHRHPGTAAWFLPYFEVRAAGCWLTAGAAPASAVSVAFCGHAGAAGCAEALRGNGALVVLGNGAGDANGEPNLDTLGLPVFRTRGLDELLDALRSAHKDRSLIVGDRVFGPVPAR